MVQEETMSVAYTPVEKTVEAKKDTSNVKSQEIAPLCGIRISLDKDDDTLKNKKKKFENTRGICSILFFFSFLTFCVRLQQIGRHSAPVCIGFVLKFYTYISNYIIAKTNQ